MCMLIINWHFSCKLKFTGTSRQALWFWLLFRMFCLEALFASYNERRIPSRRKCSVRWERERTMLTPPSLVAVIQVPSGPWFWLTVSAFVFNLWHFLKLFLTLVLQYCESPHPCSVDEEALLTLWSWALTPLGTTFGVTKRWCWNPISRDGRAVWLDFDFSFFPVR